MSVNPSVFTRVISGEWPGRFVWRDEHVVAFLTIAPIAEGHVLVVPIEQIDHWLDVPPAVWARVSEVAHHVGRAIQTAFSPNRVGMIIAGLEVPHCHVHLVPIETEADLDFAKADPSPAPESLDTAMEHIRAALREAGQGEHVPD